MRFLYISSGSAHELEYLVFLSTELKYIESENSKKLLSELDEIKRMLASLIRKISSTL